MTDEEILALEQRRAENIKRHEEHVQRRDRQRQKDAKLTKLLGKPVVCLNGFFDPEAGYFCVDMPEPLLYEVAKRNGEDVSRYTPFIVLDEAKHQKLMDAMIDKYYIIENDKLGFLRLRRKDNFIDIEDDEDKDINGFPTPNIYNDDYFVDLPDVPWNPEIRDTGIAYVVEFCTGDCEAKKWRWQAVPRYSTDLNSVQDVEKLLTDGQISLYVEYLTNITNLTTAASLIKATAEQKTDALIKLFEQELC